MHKKLFDIVFSLYLTPVVFKVCIIQWNFYVLSESHFKNASKSEGYGSSELSNGQGKLKYVYS